MHEKAFAVYDTNKMKVNLLELFGEGDSTSVRFEVDSDTTSAWHWKVDYVAIFNVVEGRIRGVRECFDSARLIQVVFE
jgi:hypothetical protein